MPGTAEENKEVVETKDDFGNLKAEFNRKIDSVKDALTQTTAQLTAQLKALIPKEDRGTPVKASNQRTIKEVWWDDEEEAARMVKDQAKAEIREELKVQQRKTDTIANLAIDFPELRDMGHSLTKKAIEVYNNMSDAEKETAAGYKLAVLEAAAQEGIVPMSKRSKGEDDDDFVGGGSNSGSKKQARNKKDGELSAETMEFAEAMGLDTSDTKVMDRLKKTNSRRDWQNFKKP